MLAKFTIKDKIDFVIFPETGFTEYVINDTKDLNLIGEE